MIPFARIVKYGNAIEYLNSKSTVLNTKGYVMLTDDGKLYGKGTQIYGQFGLGDKLEKTSKVLISDNVANFWFSDVGLTILKTDGSYWFSGAALAYGNTDSVFVNIDNLIADKFNNAVEIYVARGHSTVVCNLDGSVWVLGANTYGLVGLASTSTHASVWTQNTRLTDVKKIQFGALNACGIKDNGDVVGWGDNRFSCFGTSWGTSYIQPTVVKSGVIDFYLTGSFCFMWSTAVSVYISGYTGDGGMLNCPASSTYQAYNIYTRTQPLTYISSEFSFIKHANYAFMETANFPVYVRYRNNGDVYGSGYNSSNSLGVDSSITNQFNTVVVPGGEKMNTWIAGSQSTKLAVIDNKLYVAGEVRYLLDLPASEIYSTFKPLNII